jgi:hypothetical protein
MWGKKARIYYHGLPLFCVNCYEIGHSAKDCGSDSITWRNYIERLLQTGIKPVLFGSWLASNVSCPRELEFNVPQPSFEITESDNEFELDEDIDLSNVPPQMLKLFQKLKASTPKISSQNQQNSRDSTQQVPLLKGRNNNFSNSSNFSNQNQSNPRNQFRNFSNPNFSNQGQNQSQNQFQNRRDTFSNQRSNYAQNQNFRQNFNQNQNFNQSQSDKPMRRGRGNGRGNNRGYGRGNGFNGNNQGFNQGFGRGFGRGGFQY